MSISEGSLNLYGIASDDSDSNHNLNPAILFKLDDSLLEDVKKACGSPDGCHFLGGTIPKIKLGKRTFDLTISNEAFRHELYAASSEAFGDLNLTGIVGHRAELNLPERKQSAGSDAALATLQNSLASYQQEKEAKSVNINNNVVAVPKHRWEAYHQQKQAKRRGLVGSQPCSPSLNASRTPNVGQAPTSMPASDALIRTQAMKTPLTHLLAIGPLSREQILEKTRIPKDDLDEVLGKMAKQDRGKWQLVDRAYKDLDVFKFGYQSEEDRKRAIDNAVGAFDRMRIGKDEKTWQMLLPQEDRDKGIVLSKLHLGANGPAKLTPNLAGSPMMHAGAGAGAGGDGTGESKAISAANTPRLGPSATPKATSGKSEGGALAKRLLSKDPKKQQLQRAKDEAKEKKRKERDAAPGERESGKPARKKQMTARNSDTNMKVKSAEFVRSSSEESEGEVKEKEKESAKEIRSVGKSSNGSSHQPKVASASSASASSASASSASSANAARASNNNKSASATNATARKTTVPAAATASPNASDAGTKPKGKSATSAASTPKTATLAAAAAAAKQKANNATATTSKYSKAAVPGRSTPNGLAASASQARNQLSPQKHQHRPTAPSPLGAARPRVASDVSERGAVGVQRVRQGAETPKGLGITNGFRKRQDTVTSTESFGSIHSEKMNGDHKKRPSDKAQKPLVNGTATPKATTNGHARRTEAGTKRKAVDSPAQSEDDQRTEKHRKTDSSSSESVALDANGIELTFSYGVDMVRRFQEDLYPRYTEMYHEQLAMKKRGEQVPRDASQRLWDMHNRLKEMKAQMQAASQREHEHE